MAQCPTSRSLLLLVVLLGAAAVRISAGRAGQVAEKKRKNVLFFAVDGTLL